MRISFTSLLIVASASALRPLPTLTRSVTAPRSCRLLASEAADTVAAGSVGSLPPDSFAELIEHAAESTKLAVSDGGNLLEVEFPPLPISALEDSSLSAADIIGVNLRLCVEYCKKLTGPDGPAGGKPIAITLPDVAELRRAVKYLGDSEPAGNVRLNSLGGDASADTGGAFGFFGSIFKQSGGGDVVPADWTGMYVIVGASCQELPTLRKLSELQPSVPIVLFNLKLDTQRGDLGLPAFPPRSVHHEFLSRVKPVYYMRPRSYSLSLSRPPFLMAYSGVLFRRYPEGWQSLLDRGARRGPADRTMAGEHSSFLSASYARGALAARRVGSHDHGPRAHAPPSRDPPQVRASRIARSKSSRSDLRWAPSRPRLPPRCASTTTPPTRPSRRRASSSRRGGRTTRRGWMSRWNGGNERLHAARCW